MSVFDFRLANAPIVEAVLDINCDMPPTFDLAAMKKSAHDRYRDQYPKLRMQFIQETKMETQPTATPQLSIRRVVIRPLLF